MTDVATTRHWPDLRVAELGDVRTFIRERAHAERATDAVVDDLVQAADELVCNVIEHGYPDHVGPVTVAIGRDADRIRITIVDDAPPYDPTRQPPPRLDLPLEERPLGGMGVHLARTLTDRMRHRILPGGGNEVTLEKRL